MIDVAKGGSVQGEIDALNRLLEMMIPPFPLRWRDERTYVIPGHGFVADYGDVVEYRNVVTIVRDRIADMIARGMTLEQVKAADPTKGFRKRYGSDSGAMDDGEVRRSCFQRVESQEMRSATAVLLVSLLMTGRRRRARQRHASTGLDGSRRRPD